MQTVQSSGSVETPPVAGNTKAVLKWATLGLVGIVNGYATILMYSRGEVAFALLTLIITALALYIFGSKKTYAHRYIYPGIAGMILFILFPLAYTVNLAFTNYSAKNQLSLERTQSVLEGRTFQSGESFSFTLLKTAGGHVITVQNGEQTLATPEINLTKEIEGQDINLSVVDSVAGEKEPIKSIIQYRPILSTIDFIMPNDDADAIRMSGLRKFAAVEQLFEKHYVDGSWDGQTLFNNETQQKFLPNMDTGFYQPVDENGNFVGNSVSPGFVVGVGTHNFERVWKDEALKSRLSQSSSGRLSSLFAPLSSLLLSV